jgi:8-oxo-dGTP pyrophosphatase MutT (NUDIX family)
MKKAAGIILFNDKNEVLIEHPTNHDPNFWSFPKGLIDENETPSQAAVRELYEETSLNLYDISYEVIEELPWIKFKNNRKTLKLFVIKTDEKLDDFQFKCPSLVTKNRKGEALENPFPEVDDYKWVSLEEAYPLLHEAQQRALRFMDHLKSPRGTFSDKKRIGDVVYDSFGNVLKVTDHSLEDEYKIFISPIESNHIKYDEGIWAYSDQVMSKREYREVNINNILGVKISFLKMLFI